MHLDAQFEEFIYFAAAVTLATAFLTVPAAT
jgi:hypothetical protein